MITVANTLKVNRVLTSINLDGFALPVKQLKGTELVESLDLSCKGLGVLSGIVIAKLIEVNRVLIAVNLSSNELCGLGKFSGTYDASGITALAEAFAKMPNLTSLE